MFNVDIKLKEAYSFFKFFRFLNTMLISVILFLEMLSYFILFLHSKSENYWIYLFIKPKSCKNKFVLYDCKSGRYEK